ncbi:hypothetical protein [Deinococcus sp. UYEF24]
MTQPSIFSRKFRIVDLFQSGIEAGQPIPDLAEIKLNDQPFTLGMLQYTNHLACLRDPFNETIAQSVAEAFSVHECRFGDDSDFDLLVFEQDNDLTFRIAVRVERKPVADMLSSIEVKP